MLIVRRILLVIFIITCGTTTVALAQGGQHGPPGPIGNFQVPNGTDAHGNQVLKGDNLFTNVFEEFHSAASKWYPVMKNAAIDLFWGLAAISMVWTFGQLALGGADLGRFFSEAIRFFVFIGFNWFLLDKAGGSVGELGRMIFDTFGQLGSNASNYHHDIMNPGVMFDRGFALFTVCMVQATSLGWSQVGQYIALVALGYGILILAAIISINVLMVMISYWFASYAGIFILGFGGSRWTSDMAINYYKSLLGIGIQLLGMVLVIDVGDRVVNTYMESLYVVGVKTQSLGVVVVVLFCIWKISTTVPGLLAGMLSGHSATGVSNTGNSIVGGVGSLAMGLATAGAGLGAMAGAKLLGGGGGGEGGNAGSSGGNGGAGNGFLSAFQSPASSGDDAKQLANSVPDLGGAGGGSTAESPSLGGAEGGDGTSVDLSKGDDAPDGGVDASASVDASNDGDSSTAGGVDVEDGAPVVDASNDGDDSTAGGVDVDAGSGGGSGGGKSSPGSAGGQAGGKGAVAGAGGKGKGKVAAASGAKDGMTDAQKKMHSIGQAMFQKGSKQAMAAVMGRQAAEAIGMSADALGASADAAWEKLKEKQGASGDGKTSSSSGSPKDTSDSKGGSGGVDSDSGMSGRNSGSDEVGGAPAHDVEDGAAAPEVGHGGGSGDDAGAPAPSGATTDGAIGQAGASGPSPAPDGGGSTASQGSSSNQKAIATLENSARQAAAAGDTASAAAFTAMAVTAKEISAKGQSITSGPGKAKVESAGDQAWQQAKAKAAPGPAPSAGPGHSAPSASPAAPGAAPRPSAAPGPAPSPGPAPAPSAAPAGAPGPAPSAGPGHSAPSASPAAPPPPPPPVAEEPPPWDGSWDGSMGGEEPPPWTDDDF